MILLNKTDISEVNKNVSTINFIVLSLKNKGVIMAKKEKVLVIMGGTSTEREVSLRSGAAVVKALTEAGYDAIPFDVQPDNVNKIKEINPDVAFLALFYNRLL